MTDLARINDLNADAAAALWLVKQDQGLDLDADPRFAAWLNGAPANGLAWDKARALWGDFDGPDDVLVASMRQAALAARPAPRPYLAWAAAAAAVAIIAAGGFGWRALSVKPVRGDAAVLIAADARPDYLTQVGQQSELALPDGTGVALDTNSAIVVRYTPGHRTVRLLRGRAYFTVVHDPKSPFVVAAGDRTVTDVGTEFAVTNRPDALSVTLAKGAVAIRGKGASRTLQPGQQLVGRMGANDVVSSVDLNQILAWRTGFLEFHEEPLGEAVAEMNRYGATPVAVPDPATAALRISGRFRAGDPARFAQALAEIYPVKLVHGAGGPEIAAAR